MFPKGLKQQVLKVSNPKDDHCHSFHVNVIGIKIRHLIFVISPQLVRLWSSYDIRTITTRVILVVHTFRVASVLELNFNAEVGHSNFCYQNLLLEIIPDKLKRRGVSFRQVLRQKFP